MDKMQEVEEMFDYLLDKIQPCYKQECEIAVDRFLKEVKE